MVAVDVPISNKNFTIGEKEVIMMKIAVKELANFLYSSGNLTYEFFYNRDENEGQKAHQFLQRRFSESSKAEVYIKRKEIIDDCEIEINGFIDGLHENHLLEEIKSTKLDLEDIEEDYHKEYLAQLKIYMAMYLLNHDLSTIAGRLTYINLTSYETKSFDYHFEKTSILDFYYESLKSYLLWQLFLENDHKLKNASLKKLRFPFQEYRRGQQDFMKAVFCTLRDHQILYGVAPTGIGKTVSVLYPALKSLKNPKDKIFYLTAKTTLKKLAIDTTSLMIKSGANIRLLELTSKEKSCFLHQEFCDPDNCPYAKNFFEKLRDAIKDILTERVITKDIVDYYASVHLLCPFEFSLYVSEYVDVVVGDYNYVFDPQVRLIRYFEEENDYNVYALIDESHNLIDRARSMYSEELSIDILKQMKRSFKGLKPTINKNINNVINFIKEIFSDKENDYLIFEDVHKEIIDNLESLIDKCQKIFEETPADKFKNRQNCMKEYLAIKSFLKINEYYSDAHKFIIERENDNYLLKISCLNAAKFTHQSMKKLQGVVLFSATLTPLDYFKQLLTEGEGEHIILSSPFKYENLKLVFMDKVDTYYQNRSQSVEQIIETIDIMVKAKQGNYIVFFPSYQYLKMVLDKVKNRNNYYQIIEQEKDMPLEERELIIELFDDNDVAKVGFFVMGGMFSEGVDFIGDKLSGVLIVGVAIPQVNYQNELLKKHFEDKFDKGFEYAYTYPGFNKVLQAAGRVIRSASDQGVVVIADKRITNYRYLSILPEHWHHFQRINKAYEFKNELDKFWKK